jgi:hypothetical protein
MSTSIRAILLLLLTLLFQILVFRFGIFAGGWAIIFFHLYGIAMLPVGWHKTAYLFIGAVIGITLDIILHTGGLHMASGAFLGLLLPMLSSVISPREGFLKGHVISALKDGWVRYLSYCFLIAFTYSFALFAVEGGRVSLLPSALGKALFSGVLNLVILGITQGLFGIKRKTNKSKVSAYPWS